MKGRAKLLPVVAIGSDRWGQPTRMSLPGGHAGRLPIRVKGIPVGTLAPDGSVTWSEPNMHARPAEYQLVGDLVSAVRPGWRRDAIRVVLIDGRISHVDVETDPEVLARRGSARLDAKYAEPGGTGATDALGVNVIRRRVDPRRPDRWPMSASTPA